MTLDQLADKIKQPGGDAGQQQAGELCEKAKPYIYKIIKRLDIPKGIEYGSEDLEQEAMIAVLESLEKYQPSRASKFSTYMYIRVRGKLISYLRKHDTLSRGERNRVGELRDARHTLEQEHGRYPAVTELAELLDTTPEAVRASLTAEATRQSSSIDSEDVPPQGELDRSLERKFTRSYLFHKLGQLPVQSRVMLILVFFYGLTRKQTKKVLGVSYSLVWTLQDRALTWLRE